jgi:hypothetical protein
MDTNKRLVEIMSDLLIEVQHLRKDSNKRLEKLERQQVNTNKGLSELRLSVMTFAQKFETVVEHEKRLNRLEKIVLK